MIENKELQKDHQDPKQEIRKKFRSISLTTLLLLIVLIGAIAIKIIKPPVSYILFCIIFVADFAMNAYLIWTSKMFWWRSKSFLEGTRARIAAIGYGALSLCMLAFAIFFLLR